MLSTGEVMGRGASFEEAFIKSQIAASNSLRPTGNVFLGVRDVDKEATIPLARALQSLGYQVLATPGTRRALLRGGLEAITETSLETAADGNLYGYMRDETLALVINTTRPGKRRIDPTHLRRMVLTYQIPYCTTIEAARTMVEALVHLGPDRTFTYAPLRGYRQAPRGAS
jgi:carbamoyl-phosphate synthase large subunit